MTTTATRKRTSAKPKSTGRVTAPKTAEPKADWYKTFSDKLIELSLSKEKLIWHMEWKRLGKDQHGFAMPRSVATGKLYRGLNPWILWAAMIEFGWDSIWFATYDEWARLSGAVNTAPEGERKHWVHPDGIDFGVRKGEKAIPIIWWAKIFVDAKDANGNVIIDPKTGKPKRKRISILKHINVFNQAQVHQGPLPKKFQPQPEGTVEEDPTEAFDPIAEAEAIVNGYTEVEVRQGGDRAYYSPRADYIGMPEKHQFNSPEAWYSTLFHEMGHSTGHQSRLARKDLLELHSFGDVSYSKEELTAEFTAAMLCGIAGIENATINNSAAYLQSWVSKLRDEPKWLVQAAALAQRAADYIQGIRYTDEEVTD